MARESVLLNELNLNYKEIIRDRAFLIKPRSLRYSIEIVLIVQDPKEEDYQMILWMDQDVKKEINFTKSANILNTYNSMYAFARRVFDNHLKTSKNENTKRIPGDPETNDA